MGKKIVLWFIGILGSSFGKYLGVFLISMLPIVELRGAIPVAYALHIPWTVALIVSILGNLLPVPFIILFVDKVFVFMKEKHILEDFVIKLEKKALSKSESVKKYEFFGLAIFVAIPLPGTGAWTGALIASVLEMPKKEAILSITLGVLMAAIIVTTLTYGLLPLI
jgi:uncharacterized membrane protein